jgi:hypothetical protein
MDASLGETHDTGGASAGHLREGSRRVSVHHVKQANRMFSWRIGHENVQLTLLT